jgi:histidinol-phosphatase
MTLEDDLELARRLGGLAAETALPYFRAGVRRDVKADGTPVTEADLAVERVLLDELRAARPDDSIVSEESGAEDRDPSRRWLIDPIDGTAYFASDDPAWGTHVALEVDGELVLGVITRPVEGRSWWAARGMGAWSSEGKHLQVSSKEVLPGARIGGYVPATSTWKTQVVSRATWVDHPSPMLELIEGRIDAVLSESGCEWDHAPGVILLQEAGGRFTDLDGGSRIDLRGGLYSNVHLHEPLMQLRGPA